MTGQPAPGPPPPSVPRARPGSTWVRLTALSVSVLAACLAATVAIAWELALRQGKADVDAVLLRERDVLAATAPGLLDGLGPGAGAELAGRLEGYLATQPGSDRHLTRIVVTGVRDLSTAAGPAEVVALRDGNRLPAGEPGRLVTRQTSAGGVRVLSVPLTVRGTAVGEVEVFGFLGAVEDDAALVVGRAGLAAGAAGLFGVLALALAFRRATRPLRALHDATDQAGLADLTLRVPDPGGRGEVGDLARAFNRMLGRLEREVSARSALFASVSHELRTPVAVARGHVELVTSGAARDPQASLRLVNDELGRLSRLLDDLLLLASAEAGALVTPQPVPVRRLVEEIRIRLDGLGMDSVAVGVDPAAGLDGRPSTGPDPQLDPDRVLQAVVNLVINARTHTPDGTPVKVRLTPTADQLQIMVMDAGQGIDPGIRDRVLDPFVGSGRSSTGLGLAVVKAVMDAHQGAIDVETGPAGTRITLSFPTRGPAVPQRPRDGGSTAGCESSP